MNSREALDKISWRYVNEPSFQEWCNIIKQDLERLENLEEENASLQSENESLHNSLEKAEMLLKHSIDNNNETLNALSKQIKQNNNLKQVIEILKNKEVPITWLKISKSVNEYNSGIFKFAWLTQEEYELLKEYFGNDEK